MTLPCLVQGLGTAFVAQQLLLQVPAKLLRFKLHQGVVVASGSAGVGSAAAGSAAAAPAALVE